MGNDLTFVVVDYRQEAVAGEEDAFHSFKLACGLEEVRVVELAPETDVVSVMIGDIMTSLRAPEGTLPEGVQTDKLVCIVGMDTPVHNNLPLYARLAQIEYTQPAEPLLAHLYDNGVPFFVMTPDVYELNQKLLILPSWIKQLQDQGSDYTGLTDLVRAKGARGFRDSCVKALELMHREGGGLTNSVAARVESRNRGARIRAFDL